MYNLYYSIFLLFQFYLNIELYYLLKLRLFAHSGTL